MNDTVIVTKPTYKEVKGFCKNVSDLDKANMIYRKNLITKILSISIFLIVLSMILILFLQGFHIKGFHLNDALITSSTQFFLVSALGSLLYALKKINQ